MKATLSVMAALTAALCLIVTISQAQTKVFKEVSEDISSQMSIIEQDGALVGYLMFTQLEKASADSFNYRITIMDENLNDIGTVHFREQKLLLRAVSYEGDVICLAYLKSNFAGVPFRTRKEYNRALSDDRSYVFTQFLSMNGKIMATDAIKAQLIINGSYIGMTSGNVGSGSLKHDIQLRNIGGKGFACFFGDERRNNLYVYNTAGQRIWEIPVKETATEFGLMTSGQDVYLITKSKNEAKEGGFGLIGYSTSDSTLIPRYSFVDKNGDPLKVLSFENDPVTGKPYASGLIISQEQSEGMPMGRNVSRGLYAGCFTINFNGHKKGDIQAVYSYWGNGDQPLITKKGYMESARGYVWVDGSFRDYQGNTYFTGSSMIRRMRWGAAVAAVILSPTIIAPVIILGAGTQKYKMTDAIVLKQSAKGALTLENSIPGQSSPFGFANMPISMFDNRGIHSVVNSDTKTNFLVIDDPKNITIYNVNQKKVARTIPHKDGNVSTSVYPAKEGHVMVSEYNRKERFTRLSIETL